MKFCGNGNMKPNNLTILAEQTSHIYAAVIKAILATIINSTILTIVLWPVISHTILLTWLTLLLLLSIIRSFTVYRYKLASPSPEEVKIWTHRFMLGSIAASTIWGSSSILLFPTDDLTRQVFLAFVLGGMAAGAITSLSYIKLAVYIFLGFTLIPLAIRFFYSGTELSLAMGTMITVYFVVLLQSAKQSHTISTQNISMQIENIDQERSLNKSERRYKILLETATDAFFLFDLNGKFLDVNNQACQSLGYTRDELLTMSASDIGVTSDNKLPNLIWKDLKDGETIQAEGIHTRKDGSTFPVEVNLGIIHVGDESLLSVLARDISERKRVDKMKDEFISTVSHELRTPLTSIKGSLGLLTGGALGEMPDNAKEMLTVADNNAERLLLLINDILDIQKIESGELEMELKNMELTPFLKQAIQDNSSYADQYGVSLILQPIEQNVSIYGNKDRLMQVMANLLSNAAKFSHAEGTVEISVKDIDDSTVRISVTDHGQGIPKEFYSTIFDRFTQYDSSDTRNKGGTGLGLNITKEIIEKHGGKIAFISDIDAGTTFYFDLPKL